MLLLHYTRIINYIVTHFLRLVITELFPFFSIVFIFVRGIIFLAEIYYRLYDPDVYAGLFRVWESVIPSFVSCIGCQCEIDFQYFWCKDIYGKVMDPENTLRVYHWCLYSKIQLVSLQVINLREHVACVTILGKKMSLDQDIYLLW